MKDELNPVPAGQIRHDMAHRVRLEAAEIAHGRAGPTTQTDNGEATAALAVSGAVTSAWGTFTKGLDHDEYGRVATADLRRLVSEINQDAAGSAAGETPLPGTYASGLPAIFDVPKAADGGRHRPPHDAGTRNWESPLAGHTLELCGPDPDAVTMPPAPALGSAELVAEMAEIYAMALLRDVPFKLWDADPEAHSGAERAQVQAARDAVDRVVTALAKLDFYAGDDGLDDRAKRRRAARSLHAGGLTAGNLFRGSTRGAHKGPYVSQFMLVGNKEKTGASETPPATEAAGSKAIDDALNRPRRFVPDLMKLEAGTESGGKETGGRENGVIQYGAQIIFQRLIPHRPGRDHMTDWGAWHDVQNGANRKGEDYFLEEGGKSVSRFLTTPRDMATYVHFDALYQAYLNACLILLGDGAAVDAGLPEGGFLKDGQGHDTRDGFALFGGPHILTLVCEVATRALKAVRRQKYNVHLRARPEALAAAIALDWNKSGDPVLGHRAAEIRTMREALEGCGLLKLVSDHNDRQNRVWEEHGWPVHLNWISPDCNALLPMAFPEGSPMHPSYGAGHATVAGACVTMLKAFFEMYDVTRGDAFRKGAIKRGALDIKALMAQGGAYPGSFPASLFQTERELADLGFDCAWQGDPALGQVPDGGEAGDLDQTLAGARLCDQPLDGLTLQGELDKLAANIAIARDFAGVHFYTDYYESLRMGERIAIGMLQEQMVTYREPVSMRLTSFDGDRIMLVGTGGSRDLDDTPVYVWDQNGAGGTKAAFEEWWTRGA